MKLVLIALGLLATTGVVYAACIFCCVDRQENKEPGFAAGLFVCLGRALLNQGARISPAESYAMVDFRGT
jgi:hypothetical protein